MTTEYTNKPVIRFEKLWAAYTAALEIYDAAKAQREEGHGRRVCRAARARVEALHGLLVSEYNMQIGGAL